MEKEGSISFFVLSLNHTCRGIKLDFLSLNPECGQVREKPPRLFVFYYLSAETDLLPGKEGRKNSLYTHPEPFLFLLPGILWAFCGLFAKSSIWTLNCLFVWPAA